MAGKGPHIGDCVHPVRHRSLREEEGLYVVGCGLCHLSGRRRADLQEEAERLERLMNEPPVGVRVIRGRKV